MARSLPGLCTQTLVKGGSMSCEVFSPQTDQSENRGTWQLGGWGGDLTAVLGAVAVGPQGGTCPNASDHRPSTPALSVCQLHLKEDGKKELFSPERGRGSCELDV